MFGQWNTSQSGIAKLRLVTLQLQGEVSAASLLQLAIRHGASYRRRDVENQESWSRLRGVWTQTATVVKSSASDRTPSPCLNFSELLVCKEMVASISPIW